MCHVAAEMERQNFNLPLLIGGATTSRVHTAVKIHPNYKHGQTVYVTDASRAVGVDVGADVARGPRRLSRRHPRGICADRRSACARRRKTRSGSRCRIARANAPKIDWANYAPPKPSFIGTKVLEDYPLAELAPYIDWTPFFATWELMGTYPQILDDSKYGPAARALYRGRAGDAQADRRPKAGSRRRAWSASGRPMPWATTSLCMTRRARKRSRRCIRCASRSRAAKAAPMSRCRISSRRERRPAGLCRRLHRDRRHRRGRRRRPLQACQRRLFRDHGQGAGRSPGRSVRRAAASDACAKNSGAMCRTRPSRPPT